MMNLEDLKAKRAKLYDKIEKLTEDIDVEEARREKFQPLLCNCGRKGWDIRTTYNPHKMMAYEWRELILECECGETIHINVQEDF